MPAAPRPKGKARKIAYEILGKPQNMIDEKRKSQWDRHVEERLTFEDTYRVR